MERVAFSHQTPGTRSGHWERNIQFGEQGRRRIAGYSARGYNDSGRKFFRPAEDELVRQHYPNYRLLVDLMPRHPLKAIQNRAKVLGLPRAANRSPRFMKPERLLVLRRLYTTVTTDELRSQFPDYDMPYLHRIAYRRRWRRPRRPYVPTGFAELDELRAKCFRLRYTMVDLREWTGCSYFNGGWRSRKLINARAMRKAWKALNG